MECSPGDRPSPAGRPEPAQRRLVDQQSQMPNPEAELAYLRNRRKQLEQDLKGHSAQVAFAQEKLDKNQASIDKKLAEIAAAQAAPAPEPTPAPDPTSTE